jgi:methylated-DNA-[protein]-cysteine S-methyltransferase
MTTYSSFDSPVGELLLVGDDDGLRGLYLPDHRRGPARAADWARDDAALAGVREQLAEYFAGERTDFDLPLAPAGTPFQLEVWEALRGIPYGETETYGELAARVGRPGSARAVGAANGRNPISIVVPCHRVVGAAGALTGYAGGLEAKERLLAHEAGAV